MRNKNLTAFLFLELSYDRDVKNSWNEKKCQRKRPTLVESRDDALRSKDRHMKTSTEWPYVGLKVERSTLKHVDRMVLPTQALWSKMDRPNLTPTYTNLTVDLPEHRKVVGSNPVTGVLDRSGVKVTKVLLIHPAWFFLEL